MNHIHTYDEVYEMSLIRKIGEHFKKRQLGSFDEVEPNIFVLKQEIVNRLNSKINKTRKRKLKKRNYK